MATLRPITTALTTTLQNDIARCGARTTQSHFFYCRLGFHKELLQGKEGRQLTIKEVLETVEGAQAFSQWVKTSNYYTISCRQGQPPLPFLPPPPLLLQTLQGS